MGINDEDCESEFDGIDKLSKNASRNVGHFPDLVLWLSRKTIERICDAKTMLRLNSE